MFGLLPITKVIATTAGVYATSFLALYLLFATFDVHLRLLMAFSSAAVVDWVLLYFVNLGWRQLWAVIPGLGRWLFPDLNGDWHATIDWVRGKQAGQATGTVQIKQDFFKLSIEMDAERSDSRTIALALKRDPESGRSVLHYIYEVTEKHTSPGQNMVYQGAASLSIRTSPEELAGNYFTSRGTGGRFRFRRLSSRP
jgi:hypothetical protein